MRLPELFDPSTFPVAERSALRLDGELFPLAEALITLDALDSPELRARAAHAGRGPRLIAELETAAWIWGALPAPPGRLQFCAAMEERSRLRPGDPGAGREVVMPAEDEFLLAGRRVTTPLRTALDLVRLRDDASYDAAVVGRLLGDDGAERAMTALAARRLPHAARARRRLAGLSRP